MLGARFAARSLAWAGLAALTLVGCATPAQPPPPSPPPASATPETPPPLPAPPPPPPEAPAVPPRDAEPTPPGANDWSCRPDPAHPRPVVLVHGGLTNMMRSWLALSPVLVDAGYCVFTLNHGGMPDSAATGRYGVAGVAESAAQLDAFVDRVLAATGADEVDLVGHSLGGLVPRYLLKFLGGADRVGTLVGLAPSNHGSDLSVITGGRPLSPELVAQCPVCLEQVAGSPLLTRLNADGETVPGVAYTVIATERDLLVTPIESAFLDGPGVTNLTVQQLCPRRAVDHATILFDPVVHNLVRGALDPAAAVPPDCDVPPPA